MSLSRKVKRASERPKRKTFARMQALARKTVAAETWAERAEARQILDECSGPDDLVGVDVNTVRHLALMAGLSLVILYSIAAVVSGC